MIALTLNRLIYLQANGLEASEDSQEGQSDTSCILLQLSTVPNVHYLYGTVLHVVGNGSILLR
jgi:hypothetical protein